MSTDRASAAPVPPVPRSQVREIVWPAIVDGAGAQALALQFQLAQSEWWPAERLRAQQMRQLGALVAHALGTVPYYRGVLPRGLLDPQGGLDPVRWAEVPVLTREAVQRAGSELASGFVPRDHGPVSIVRTSGATGRPVEVGMTAVPRAFWSAFTLREHLWQRRDLGGKLAIIRYFHDPKQVPPGGSRRQGWGAATDAVFDSGPSAMLSVHTDIKTQAAWLLQEDPDYLLSYPSNLEALAGYFIEHGLRLPRLREVRSVSEMLSDAVRDICRRAWDAPVTDIYSTQEIGYLALQCPAHEHYHVMAEDVLLEVLDDDGRPCAPGQSGRVVVTPLHNFATVLLRYELGDYAEAGEPCPCGRSLPMIRRILGRTRNMMTLPDGRFIWPRLSQSLYRTMAPVFQVQILQRSIDRVEFRYVADRPITEAEQATLTAFIHENFDYPMAVDFTRVEAIARSASGKFEDFISEVPRRAR